MDFKIKHKDGTEVRLISSANKSCVTSAVQKRKLCGEDTVTINLTSAEYIQFYTGDTIDVFGTTYTINQLPTVKKINDRNYEYTLVFEGLQYTLIDRVFLMPDNTQGNNLMFDLEGMMNVLVDNINRGLGENDKHYNFVCPTGTEYKNLSLTEKNCLQVLQQLCQEWDTEFTIVEGEQYITIKVGQAGSIFPIPFTYGANGGIYELNRDKGATDLVTRLFAYGGTQNLTYYRHNRLCLPNKTKNESYVEDATAQATYGLKEAVKNFDDIYPDRRGTVTSISGCAYNEFIDSSMADPDDPNYGFDLNEKWPNTEAGCEEWLALKGLEDTTQNRNIYFNDVAGTATRYLIPETTAKIHFNTGALAGYEIDLHAYDHSTNKFILQPLVDENGYDFPSKYTDGFRIAEGDEYIIVDINLPEVYKQQAEAKLLTAADDYFDTVSSPQPKYTLELEPLALRKIIDGLHSTGEREIFATGDTVKITDTENGITEGRIRIDSFERDLIDTYKYKLSLTDEITYTAQVRTLIEVNQIKRVVEESKIYDVNRIRRGWRDVEEMYNMVFDTEGQIYGEKIQPLSIDTTMLKVGARSQQLVLQNITFTPNAKNLRSEDDPTLFRIDSDSGNLSHYSILDGSGNPRVWNIGSDTIDLTNLGSGGLYVYAKCPRTGTSGEIDVSADQIVFDRIPNYYYFLIGTLSSIEAINYADGTSVDMRTFAATYGYTAINGRFVRTGRIQSADGETFFDLDEGKIGGNIVFQSGSSEVRIDEYIADEVGTEISGLGLDGTNLLPITNFWEQGTTNNESNPSYTYADMKAASTTRIRTKSNKNLEVGEKYTLHCGSGFEIGYVKLNNGYGAGWAGWSATPLTFTVSGFNSIAVLVKKVSDADITPSEISDAKVKLESGETATNWTLAPEDVADGIDAISNMEVGGKNILRKSKSISSLGPSTQLAPWAEGKWRNSGAGTATRIIIVEGASNYPTNAPAATNILQIVSTSASSGETSISQNLITAMVVGERYVLSFFARATSGSPKIYIQLNSGSYGGVVDSSTIATSAWKQYSVSCIYTQEQANAGGGSIYVGHYSSVGTIQICGIKLEKGNKPTDWSPAPEDTDYLRNALNEATSGSTEILGGLILTKMIQCGTRSSQAGMAGLDTSNVAFWAGGSLSSAALMATPIAILRDGNAKFGRLRISAAGDISMPVSGKSRLEITASNMSDPPTSVWNGEYWLKNGATASAGTTTIPLSIFDSGGSTRRAHSGTPVSIVGSGYVGIRASSGSAFVGSMVLKFRIGENEEEWLRIPSYHTFTTTEEYFALPSSAMTMTYVFNSSYSDMVFQLEYDAQADVIVSFYNTNKAQSGNYGAHVSWYSDVSNPKTVLAADGLICMLNATNYFRSKVVSSLLQTSMEGQIIIKGNGSGSGQSSITGCSINGSSDRKFKTDIEEFDALPLLEQLKFIAFRWNELAHEQLGEDTNKQNYGIIAQDNEGIIDGLVFDEDEFFDYKRVSYITLIPILGKAVNELSAKVAALEARIAELEGN